jgi:hypothetical protein
LDLKKISIICLFMICLISLNLFAIPRFTAKVEQKCGLCHISPNGGGMRNSYGSQYFAQTELAAHKVPYDSLGGFEPMLNKNISMGMDIRTLHHYDDSRQVKTGVKSSFFQMEGNLYLNAQLNDRVSATLNKGIYSGFEAFGLAYILPLNGYVKVGKFQPGYGWYFDDHTAFVREKMLWLPNSYDTGIEFGLLPQHFSASVSIFNGNGNTLDDGKGKAFSSRLELLEHVAGVGIGIGGSFYIDSKQAGDVSMYGPFCSLNFGKLIYTGEIDWLKDKVLSPDSLAFATTHELAFMAKQGLWVRAQYDFHDSDTKLKTGSLSRYGFGIQYFPIGFVEISPLFRYYDEALAGGKNSRYFVYDGQIHFFF